MLVTHWVGSSSQHSKISHSVASAARSSQS